MFNIVRISLPPSPFLQADEVPVEYAGEGGTRREREGQGRRRPVGGGSQDEEEEGEGGGGRGDVDDEVTTTDST